MALSIGFCACNAEVRVKGFRVSGFLGFRVSGFRVYGLGLWV
jgi:hypothetical protein